MITLNNFTEKSLIPCYLCDTGGEDTSEHVKNLRQLFLVLAWLRKRSLDEVIYDPISLECVCLFDQTELVYRYVHRYSTNEMVSYKVNQLVSKCSNHVYKTTGIANNQIYPE